MRSRGLHQVDPGPRGPPAGGHHRADPGVRRPGRYRRGPRCSNKPLPERVKKMEVTAGKAGSGSPTRSRCPTSRSSAPSAPRHRSRRSPRCSRNAHGGNMDLPDVGPGAVVYLPVKHHRRLPLSRRLSRHPRATGSCAAWAVEIPALGDAAGRSDQELEAGPWPRLEDGQVHHGRSARPGRWRTRRRASPYRELNAVAGGRVRVRGAGRLRGC